MTEHAVVIAGGGPTGLMLAGELALAGVDVAIVKRRANRSGGRLLRLTSCWPATPRTCIPQWADRASTSVCRMQ
jgi:2-polyprenyl-6-methoxyphenol hydroxylase-like FAD-dependent oxidoreductase